MSEDEMKRPVEWAARINRRWIVHHGLGTRADDWMEYLQRTDPQRLRSSCENARFMVMRWGQDCDPKPWFYSGLFSSATEEEAKRFLGGHRLTTATVPAMAEDPGVKEWEDSLCAETCGLLRRLRDGLLASEEKRAAVERQ